MTEANLRDLDRIHASPRLSEQPDTLVVAEAIHLDFRAREESLKQLRQDREERKKYAWYSFKLVCSWLAAMLVLLLLQGFGEKSPIPFHLTDTALIMAISSTTASIIAIFVFVAKYLFPQK